MAGCGFLTCSPAGDGLSLGSQAHLDGADSYVHVAIIITDVRVQQSARLIDHSFTKIYSSTMDSSLLR
jgi:hypothetical protein